MKFIPDYPMQHASARGIFFHAALGSKSYRHSIPEAASGVFPRTFRTTLSAGE
jgi:hypothetical protein